MVKRERYNSDKNLGATLESRFIRWPLTTPKREISAGGFQILITLAPGEVGLYRIPSQKENDTF